MADLDLSTVALLENCAYTGGEIVPTGGGVGGVMSFAIPAIRLVTGVSFDIEIDLAEASASVAAYSLIGPTLDDLNDSTAYYVSDPTEHTSGTTLTFSFGPAFEDYEAAIVDGETYVLFQVQHTPGNTESVTAMRTTAASPATGSTWTCPTPCSSPTSTLPTRTASTPAATSSPRRRPAEVPLPRPDVRRRRRVRSRDHHGRLGRLPLHPRDGGRDRRRVHGRRRLRARLQLEASGSTVTTIIGPGTNDWDDAATADYDAVRFETTDISAIRYRTPPGGLVADPVALNRAGGRDRSGSSVVSFEPAVAAAPAATVLGVAYPIGQAFSTPSIVGSQPVYTVSQKRAPATRDRLLFGGVDVTWIDGMATPLPDYQLVSPLLYGPATWRFPQFAAAFERPGQGRWSFLRKGARAKIQRVLVSTGEVIKTDHIGVYAGSSATDVDGGDLVVQVGGWPSGLMAPREVQPPRFAARTDVQTLMARDFESVGVPFVDPYAVKGIPIGRFGGLKMIDHVSAVLARCDTIDDPPMTVMPDDEGRFAMFRKDMTTVHGTAYLNDTQTRASLRRDFAEEPNRVYGTGVTPGGQRVLNAVYPGLLTTEAAPYPMEDDSDFGVGTENGDTDTGDGISVMLAALQTWGYLDRKDVDAGLFDDDAEAAVELLQEVADLTVTGDMDTDTWAALFNANVNGASVWWSKIEPMASLRATRKWKRNADGSIIGKNPDYRPPQRLARVDETIDMGVMNKSRMVRIAKARRAAANDPNWVGSIAFNTGGLVEGDHGYGDAFADADVLPARDLQPGMNLRLPHSVGGELLVHISGISVSSGLVTAQVDTRARDSRQVQEIIKANREARRDPARIWW